MAGALNIVYAIVVALVAIGGAAYVMMGSHGEGENERLLGDLSTVAAVTLFVIALVWTTMF